MSNHVNVPAPGATPAPEWTRSTPGAPIRRLVVISVVTVLVAAAVTATSVYLIADEAPTIGVYRDPADSAAQAAGQQLVDGIDPATDLADILRFGAGAGAVSAAEAARLAQMVDAIDPATSVRDALGLGTVRARDDTLALEELVWGIDPATDVRDVLGPRARRDHPHRRTRPRPPLSRTGSTCADIDQARRPARVGSAAPSASPATPRGRGCA